MTIFFQALLKSTRFKAPTATVKFPDSLDIQLTKATALSDGNTSRNGLDGNYDLLSPAAPANMASGVVHDGSIVVLGSGSPASSVQFWHPLAQTVLLAVAFDVVPVDLYVLVTVQAGVLVEESCAKNWGPSITDIRAGGTIP